jgi:hypothetical protein
VCATGEGELPTWCGGTSGGPAVAAWHGAVRLVVCKSELGGMVDRLQMYGQEPVPIASSNHQPLVLASCYPLLAIRANC